MQHHINIIDYLLEVGLHEVEAVEEAVGLLRVVLGRQKGEGDLALLDDFIEQRFLRARLDVCAEVGLDVLEVLLDVLEEVEEPEVREEKQPEEKAFEGQLTLMLIEAKLEVFPGKEVRKFQLGLLVDNIENGGAVLDAVEGREDVDGFDVGDGVASVAGEEQMAENEVVGAVARVAARLAQLAQEIGDFALLNEGREVSVGSLGVADEGGEVH